MGRRCLPKDRDLWSKPAEPKLEKVPKLCITGAIRYERHLLIECPGLQEGRNTWASLFSGPDTVRESMWQEDPISVAELINEYLDKVYAPAAGPVSWWPGI